MPVDRETGRPRGFAFVEFAERAVAEQAINRFNAQPFKGRPLAVSEARAREDRPPGPRPSPGGPPPSRSFAPPDPTVPAGGAGRGEKPARQFGPPATRRDRAKNQKKTEGPKGPIRIRSSGRFFDVDDDANPVEVPDFENFATSAAPDAEAEKDKSQDDDDL